jgi:phosphoserine aminotransferase
MTQKPTRKPHNPSFGSGPCAKRPGWSFDNLDQSVLGRSHRSALAKKKFTELLDRMRTILDIPADYKIGITPASDTGAVELAMWNLLGAPGISVDVFAWEQFSQLWYNDIVNELPIADKRAFDAPYGQITDMSLMEPDRDSVFVWNGTTSGVRIPDDFRFPAAGKGLRICDATSAAFAYELPWHELDVVTWSWQKVMGGEAQHGVIVMSPKARARLDAYSPTWPMPKIFQLRTATGFVDNAFFEGSPINTPSMICLEDALDSLRWMHSIGGRTAIQARVRANADTLDKWVSQRDWVTYLAQDDKTRSLTSVCLRFCGPVFNGFDKKTQQILVDRLCSSLEAEGAGYDLKAYKTAPFGLRIWCGGTVEASDIAILTEWLDWAWAEAVNFCHKK